MDPVTTLIYAVAVLVTLDVAAVTLGRNQDAKAVRRSRRRA